MNIPDNKPHQSLFDRLKHRFIGEPRNINEPSLFHKISLIPILAWIGLGADGLSSSSYGPEEAFKALGPHTYLAIFITFVITHVLLIGYGLYSHVGELGPVAQRYSGGISMDLSTIGFVGIMAIFYAPFPWAEVLIQGLRPFPRPCTSCGNRKFKRGSAPCFTWPYRWP
jgi:hypothetical protein